MKPALIVVDMVRDTLEGDHSYPITMQARMLVPVIDDLAEWMRSRGLQVVFACDSFLDGDFIFRGRLKPHSLRGSPGSLPTTLIRRTPQDIVLEKRRFSAFFKTDLDQTLRTLGVNCVLVCGITTHVCVLATVLDAVSNDFSAVILEDACAAPSREIHQAVVDAYRNTPLAPLLRVMTCEQAKQLMGG
ncbi:MAG: cysteine hydrolase [Deltaproteobacteria bacterium]|nr:MAG: cysteine hydrolase [Deltaproteobacteria bacterium]